MSAIIGTEEASTPSTPAANKWKLYWLAGGLYYLDDAGVEIGPLVVFGGAINNLSDVAITSQAQGDILYYNGSNWVNLAPGTSGWYLKTQGAAANPVWAAAAGGGDLLADGTVPLSANWDIGNFQIIFGEAGEYISGDNTDLTIASGGAIDLTATTDVVVPANVGVTFGTGEKIEGDNTDLTVTSGADIALTATGDVNIPANVGVTFGDDGEKIEGNGTDLTIASSALLNLTATTDVVIPVNVGLHLGDGAEKLESDNTDLTINSGVDINLTATTDVNIPANVGVTFGDDGEKIEGDGTDLTIASSGVLNINATGGIQLAENVGILLDAALSADGKYSGITEAGTAGATLAFGDLCYLAVADSRWELTDADAEATAGYVKLGMCVLAAGADGNATTMLLIGKIRADAAFPALTIGAAVYVGETAGDIQVAVPTGTGGIVRVVGHANTANELHFNPSPDWFELT